MPNDVRTSSRERMAGKVVLITGGAEVNDLVCRRAHLLLSAAHSWWSRTSCARNGVLDTRAITRRCMCSTMSSAMPRRKGRSHRCLDIALDGFSAAWKTNDGATVAGFFVEDGTLINPFGHRADGRAAVAAMYSEFFAGMLAGSSTTVDLASVRPVGDDHAFADGQQTINGPAGAPSLKCISRRCCGGMATAGASWTLAPTPSRPPPTEPCGAAASALTAHP
jgi:uncharacterized protein (TIGR02246 family)